MINQHTGPQKDSIFMQHIKKDNNNSNKENHSYQIVEANEELLSKFEKEKELSEKKFGTITFVSKKDSEKADTENRIQKLIKEAIAEDRVVIYLQPIYSVKEDRFTCAEVLTRIIDSNGNIIPPSIFIPIAEQTGLICDLENIILDKSCKFIKEHDFEKLGLHYIEINMSIKTGEYNNLMEKYTNILTKYNIDASKINLEITESATMEKKTNLLENMSSLIEKGFTFSLDDFGSGESNLNYVIDMPIAILKFDMNMTRAYFINDKASVVMSSAIEMAHKLGLKTVSEGVENEDMLETMKHIGVDFIQGYFFSKPLPEKDFIQFIQDYNNCS